MTSKVSKAAQDVLPPWLWFWLGASLLLTFLAGPASWLGEGVVLFAGYPELGTQLPIFRTVGLAFVLPAAVIFAGAATVALPWVRAAYLERRFGLKEPASQTPKLKEISDFVHRYEPDLEIKVNLARPNQLAFVYPLGYRKSALGVFGGLIILWGQERTTAESILLHEIGHRRHGDVLIVGAGSLLTTFVRYGLLVGTVGLAIGFAALAVNVAVPDNLRQALYFGRLLLLTPIVAILVAVPILILPLVGMWCAEFNADRFALEAQRSSDAMVKAVDKLRPRKSRWRWLLLWMTHPPDTLRRWAVRHYTKRGTLVALLLLFPVATLISALCQIVWDTYLFFDIEALLIAVDTRLDLLAPRWLAIAATILLWPFVAGLWGRLFSAGRPIAEASGEGGYRGYVYTCVLLVGLVGLYYGVSPKAVLQPGPIPAGEYSTTYFDPGFSFNVDGGWEVAAPGDSPGLLVLGQENTGEVRFQNVTGSHLNFYDKSGEVGVEHQVAPPAVHDNAVLWYALISQHPNLQVAVPRVEQIGGAKFLAFDVELSSIPRDYPQGCSRPCIPLFHYSHFNTQGEDFFLRAGNKLRILVTEVGGEPIMIAIGATEQGFDRFLNQAAGVLGSVNWNADVSSSASSSPPGSASTSVTSPSSLPASQYKTPSPSASPSPSPVGSTEEAAVIDAAKNYYQYAESGDYSTTYDLLSNESQTFYTMDEWVRANTTLDSAAAEFVVTDAYPADIGLGVPTYAVTVTVYLPDGSSFERTTYFVNEADHWAHHLSEEEVDSFNGALH
jgi:Zn-dependent protease with chaperone function